MELATMFYSPRFETSLFVASYDLQGYGGGIRTRIHTGLTHPSGKLSCSNASANHVEVTSLNSTVLAFLAVTVLLTVRCRVYRLSMSKIYIACIKILVTEVLPCICLQRTLGTCVANRHLAMADLIAGTMFTQPLAGNGCPPQPRHSGF
jgi:hypothetical protein